MESIPVVSLRAFAWSVTTYPSLPMTWCFYVRIAVAATCRG